MGGQLRWPGGCGAGSAKPVAGGLGNRAGDGADRGAGGEDVREGPSSRTVTRCPASGDPALMTRLPTLMLPDALTVRSISMIPPEGGGNGEAPAGTAPLAASRARSLASSRDGRVLIRCPPASTWTRRLSAQILMTRPVIAGPSQICCPATHRLPDGGTTRSSSTAQGAGWLVPAAAAAADPADRLVRAPGAGDPLIPAAMHQRGDHVLEHHPVADTGPVAAQRMRRVEPGQLTPSQRAELDPDRLQQA